MRRLAVILVLIIFTTCSVGSVSFSYGAKIDKLNFKGRVTETTEENDAVIIDGKDTTWFDPENLKDSYAISTEAELIGLCSLVNEEQVDRWKSTRVETFEGVTFKLTEDIKLSKPWTPIGLDESICFKGVFDGNGHTISNVNINTNADNSGFFAYLTGEVKDLNISGVNKSGVSNCGGIVGTLDAKGKVINCKSDTKVKGRDKCGGIVGYNEGGLIEGCINLGNVSGTYKVGGVVGENWGGTVNDSGNRGTVKSSRRGVATFGTGGVAGRSVSNAASINGCYNVGDIKSNTEATGGVIGYMNAIGSTVKDSYNTGNISINVKNSDKNVSPAYIGGVVGVVGINGVVIRNCYNAGIIKNEDFKGGVIGHYINDTDYPIEEKYIRNNYYVTSTFITGIGLIDDNNDPNLNKATNGVSESSMHSLASSLSVAYKKDDGGYGNNGLPVLKWQEPLSESEMISFDFIPKFTKNAIKDYYSNKSTKATYSGHIINLLSPASLTTDSFIIYMDAKDKIDKNKKEEQNDNE